MAGQYWQSPGAVTQPYWWPLPPLEGRPAPLEALVEGEAVETPHGAFFRRRLVYSLEERYGGYCVGDFLRLNAQTAAALARAPDLADVAMERTLFLDTETTGLAGGTGTYAFLVGLGYFDTSGDDPWFVLDQCMMRSYAEERAMLSWVGAFLARFEALATFNGRVFDVPLLQTRFLMSRMRLDLEEWVQFDLLPPARRLWRTAVGSCALQNLERQLLSVHREHDVESFLIPAIFHQYLRDGDGRYLQRVFNHNRADILAMVSLAIRACGALESATAGEGAARRRPPDRLSAPEYVGLAHVYEQLGNLTAAEGAYRSALDGSLLPEVRWRTMLELAALLKRTRRHEDAAAVWQAIAEAAPAHSVVALIELSKYWEHRRRDAARAHELASRARDRWLAHLPARERPLPGLPAWRAERSAPAPDDFDRRLARLERKRQVISEALGSGRAPAPAAFP
jgi:uncharacterized protein YprB with RNaseH-like and TPR domain